MPVMPKPGITKASRAKSRRAASASRMIMREMDMAGEILPGEARRWITEGRF
jgi:hypothetical protein